MLLVILINVVITERSLLWITSTGSALMPATQLPRYVAQISVPLGCSPRNYLLLYQNHEALYHGALQLILILLLSLLLLIFLGVPVAYSLGLSSLLYILFDEPALLAVLPLRLFAGFDSYALMSLPLFILMGQVMNAAQITSRLIDFSMLLMGRFRGALGLVNVLASMLFGGISGSSASDTASIGSVLIPEMERRGYRKAFASGITVASSTMGMIIPPSIPMVLYAVVAQQSVGKLFLGGVVPGVMVGVLQLVLVVFLTPKNIQRDLTEISTRTAITRTLRSMPVLAMPLFVVGSVVFGIATATESAALGVLYAVLAGFMLTRSLTISSFQECLRSSALTSSKIMIIIALSQGLHLGTGSGAHPRSHCDLRSRTGVGCNRDFTDNQPDRSGSGNCD